MTQLSTAIYRSCVAIVLFVSTASGSFAESTLIDFDAAPVYPIKVDSFDGLYPGVDFESNDTWYADAVDDSFHDALAGRAIGTTEGDPLIISFDSPVRDVGMSLASGILGVQVTYSVEGYLADQVIFSNSYVTHLATGGGDEVRAETMGIVDKLVVVKTVSEGYQALDNLSFTVVPEPSGLVVAGIGMLLIGRLTHRSSLKRDDGA